ncbi:MAG: carboxypeptidase-like regulatory domain-containing protein [Chloroflexota bacterium]
MFELHPSKKLIFCVPLFFFLIFLFFLLFAIPVGYLQAQEEPIDPTATVSREPVGTPLIEPTRPLETETPDAGSAIVVGEIVLPDGSAPDFPVLIALRNGEGGGAEAVADPGSGQFELRLPPGRYEPFISPRSDRYAGPRVEPLSLQPNSTFDLGQVELVPHAITLSGAVTTEDGRGIPNVNVVAWQRGGSAVVRGLTAENGRYELALFAGVWHIQPSPGPDQPFVFTGEGTTIMADSGSEIEGIDFVLTAADGSIKGVLFNGDRLVATDAEGWASAQLLDADLNPTDITIGAPLRSGEFLISLPAGTYLVSIQLSPGSPYLVRDGMIVTVAAGQTVSVDIPITMHSEKIVGALIDPRQNDRPVVGVSGSVGAWKNDLWTAAEIDPETGRYALNVEAGVWHLDYRIDNNAYVKIGGGENIPVPTDAEVEFHLPVTERNAGISGTVYGPDGRSLPGATVIFDGLSDGPIENLWLHTQTDENGRYRFALPYGRYRVGATFDEAWINPVEAVISVAENEVADGIDLTFQEADARIGGRLAVPNGARTGDVRLFAWTEGGAFTWTVAEVTATDDGQLSGEYALPVVAGTTWYLMAVYQHDGQYWRKGAAARVGSDGASLNIELDGPFPLPAPAVAVFDAAESQRIQLADGTVIFVPAGALPVEGEVTLRVDPIATLPHQRHARALPYGYAIHANDATGRPIEEGFNQQVLIQFPFDADGLTRDAVDLKPAYFSTTTNRWTTPARYVVDLEEGLVKMAIDHFTDFTLFEEGIVEDDTPTSSISFLFLPLIVR